MPKLNHAAVVTILIDFMCALKEGIQMSTRPEVGGKNKHREQLEEI